MTDFKLALVDLLTAFYAKTGIGITPTEAIIILLGSAVILLMFSE